MGLDARPDPPAPLEGVTVVEFGGIGPGPFAAMVLAGMGATVHRLDRPGFSDMSRTNILLRGRASIREVDVKTPEGLQIARALVAESDVLLEGFRPGVMERLGLGPDDCRQINESIVYGRMTGWGQEGPYSVRAGHDINYLAMTGVLDTIGRAGQPPLPPLNFVADYGGGAMYLVAGVLAALLRRSVTGVGVVVDAAMVDGSALFLADVISRTREGTWRDERGTNLYDSGAPFYEVYETADNRFMAVGAVEPQFYAELLEGLGITDLRIQDQNDGSAWPSTKERFRRVFGSKRLEEWRSIFEERDACVTPVLGWREAARDEHMVRRETFLTVGNGDIQPGWAPRFLDYRAMADRDRGKSLLPQKIGEHRESRA